MDPLHSKSLGRFCYKLMKQRTHAKNLAGFLCGSVFPELQNFFKGGGASQIYLCVPQRSAIVRKSRRHAHNPSRAPPENCLP